MRSAGLGEEHPFGREARAARGTRVCGMRQTVWRRALDRLDLSVPRLLVVSSPDVQLGDIQVLGLDPFKLVASTWLQGDSISSVATLPSHPYVLIGRPA